MCAAYRATGCISTHSLLAEGDVAPTASDVAALVFQPTPSSRRETRSGARKIVPSRDFNPLPPRGGRPCRSGRCPREGAFQPTPSSRRETVAQHGQDASIKISTHSLLAEGDMAVRPLRGYGKISTHSLLAEGDARDKDIGRHVHISTHSLLAEGDARHAGLRQAGQDFNPLPPRGGRPRRAIITLQPPAFQPTPSSRRETAKPANHFHHPLAKFCKLIFSFSFRAPFSPLFPSKRWLFPVRTSLAFHVRFLFAPARHTISTSSG